MIKLLILGGILNLSVLWLTAQENIKIKHIGPETKPITKLVISTTQIIEYNPFVKNIVLNSSSYKVLKDLIIQKIPKNHFIHGNDFGSFQIDIIKGKNIRTYFLPTRNESIVFFADISSEIENRNFSQELNTEFKRYLKRIQYPVNQRNGQ